MAMPPGLPADSLDPVLASIRPGLALLGFPAYVIDRQRRYRFLNEAYERYFDRRAQDMVGRTVEEVFGPPPPDDRRAALDRALAGESLTFDREALHGPPKGRWIRLHYIPVRAGGGTVRGILAILMDIEEDHRLKETLLAKSREMQLVMDNVGVPMAYIGADRRFRFANAPGPDWPQEINTANVVGRTLDEIYPPEVLRRVEPLVARALAGEQVVYERLGTNARGEQRWVRVRLTPDAIDGKVHGIFSVMIDIDDDRRLNEALARQERQLRFYAENIPEAIAFVGRDGRYEFANKTFERVRGMPAAGIIGRTVPEVLGEEAAALYFTPFMERLRRGEACSYERLAGPESGEQRWFQVRLEPHMGDDGAYAGYYVVGTDIHEIKLAQARVEEQEAKLRLFTDNVPVAIAYLDTQRRYLFVNRTFAQFRGLEPAQVIGRTSAEVLGAEAAEALTPIVKRVLAGETMTYERRLALPSGERRWVLGCAACTWWATTCRSSRTRRSSCSPARRSCASSPRTFPRRSSTSTSSAAAPS